MIAAATLFFMTALDPSAAALPTQPREFDPRLVSGVFDDEEPATVEELRGRFDSASSDEELMAVLDEIAALETRGDAGSSAGVAEALAAALFHDSIDVRKKAGLLLSVAGDRGIAMDRLLGALEGVSKEADALYLRNEKLMQKIRKPEFKTDGPFPPTEKELKKLTPEQRKELYLERLATLKANTEKLGEYLLELKEGVERIESLFGCGAVFVESLCSVAPNDTAKRARDFFIQTTKQRPAASPLVAGALLQFGDRKSVLAVVNSLSLFERAYKAHKKSEEKKKKEKPDPRIESTRARIAKENENEGDLEEKLDASLPDSLQWGPGIHHALEGFAKKNKLAGVPEWRKRSLSGSWRRWYQRHSKKFPAEPAARTDSTGDS